MSSATCGVGSGSMFGGLCSGNNRRPSMFTAKYRLREERKKVLKMSMGKVKRIEDPESFLRRSVLINNTIKRLQREVREEKMMRHGGGYGASKLSCHGFRKSFPCSRLSDMHLEEGSSISSFSSSRSRSSSLLNNNGLRKRPGLGGECEDECDVLMSGMYVPPTPCVISGFDEDECERTSPRKKAKLSMSADGSSLLVTTADECTLDVDVDVDVVGDVETSDWPTPPSPPPLPTDEPSLVSLSSGGLEDPLGSSAPLDLDVDVRCGVGGAELSESGIEMELSGVIAGDTNSLLVREEEDEEVDVDCEFNLDLSGGEAISCRTPTTGGGMDADISFRNAEDALLLEDMSSEHCKENTCTLADLGSSGGTSTPTLHLPSIVQKCSNHHSSSTPPPPSCCVCNNNNANDSCCSPSSCSSCETSSSCLSSASSNPSSPNSTTSSSSDKQYSSCGHSSIFGELQSVVFHSLIASLET